MKCFLLSTLMLAPWLTRAANLEAVTRQLARPVLIRNEHNPLLQLTVNSKKPFVQVKSITVALEGADNLKSLQFYFTGGAEGCPARNLLAKGCIRQRRWCSRATRG